LTRRELELLLLDRIRELRGTFGTLGRLCLLPFRFYPYLPLVAPFDFLYDADTFFRPVVFGLGLPEVAFPLDVKLPR
jgi:hypothetical protein